MRTLLVLRTGLAAGAVWFLGGVHANVAMGDSRGDELARWLDQRGRQEWGDPPPPCDDLTFARRVYLDVLGRVPSVAEVRDFQDLGESRRATLVEQLVFGEGPRGEIYQRLVAQNLARHWRRILVPPGTSVAAPTEALEQWLRDAFERRIGYDELVSELARVSTPQSAGGYFQILGGLPENYAGHLSRVALGVRIECAQCHDHPFTDWKQQDFWGLAAFYSDLAARPENETGSDAAPASPGSIQYEGTRYSAKYLWSQSPPAEPEHVSRVRLARWLTDQSNPHFAATAVNRAWQMLVGRGLYGDVENLDQATPGEREMLDELGRRFAEDGYDLPRLIAAICKSAWYSAPVTEKPTRESETFARTLKVISPEQVFDSLEQSLLVPVSRIDPQSPRWSGERTQLVGRLSETVGTTPEDYAAGIPQALMLMNGKMTGDAIDPAHSRLLRAVVESPFFDQDDRIETLYLAVLTRRPSREEAVAMATYVGSRPEGDARQRAYGEILWALLNSPEFVLCR